VKTVGPITRKRYRCTHCEQESVQATNHYGETYGSCENFQCVSRRPMGNATRKPPRHECLEALPEGWEKPEPWKQVDLGEFFGVVPRDSSE
jgi:hypothetical protein